MIRVSSDPYQSPSETFSTLIRAEAVCPPRSLFFFSQSFSSYICIIRALVVQYPNSSLGLTAKSFSLAIEGQDSSRGSLPNNSILQSFNICAYPLPRLLQVTPATRYQASAAAPSHQPHHTVAMAV